VLGAGKEVAIPSSVQTVLTARIDRLAPELKEVVQVGTVIGREFPVWLLEAASGRTDLRCQLAALARLELIYEKAAQPEPTYVFTHSLTREVAYASLLHQAKKRLHGVIGELLEARYADRLGEQVERLSHHFRLAEHWSKAVQYGWQAAQKAHRLGQSHAAITRFTQAQTCLLRLPEERTRQQMLIDLQLAMIWPWRHLGEPDQMLSLCREAEAVAHALSDRVRLGKAFLGYGSAYAYSGAFKQADAQYLQALNQLAGTGEEALIAFTRSCLAVAYQAQGRWQAAEPLFAESIRAQEASHTQTQYPDWAGGVLPYAAYSCVTLGYNLALRGRTRAARALVSKVFALAVQRAANLFTRTYCASWHSRVAALMGEDHGILACAEDVLKRTEETDSLPLCFRSFLAQGTALLAVGQCATARVACERALHAIVGTSHGDGLGLLYFNLAWASLALGDRAAAERYYQAGQRQTSRFMLLRARLLASGESLDFAQAESCFAQSIRADEAAGAVVLVAQMRFYLAQMLARKSDLAHAYGLLIALRRQFHAWDIPVWQRKCAQALAAMRKGSVIQRQTN